MHKGLEGSRMKRFLVLLIAYPTAVICSPLLALMSMIIVGLNLLLRSKHSRSVDVIEHLERCHQLEARRIR